MGIHLLCVMRDSKYMTIAHYNSSFTCSKLLIRMQLIRLSLCIQLMQIVLFVMDLHCHMLCCVLQVKIIKVDFGLTIDIEELINKIDADGSGEIEFEEFKTLLS
jgi:EF hand